MFGYCVKIKRTCTSSSPSTKRYGDWNETYSHKIDYKIVETHSYPDVVTSLDFQDDQNAFVVWAVFSTGNSFGRAECSSSEVFGIFEDYETAVELKKALRSFNKMREGNRLDVTTSDGQRFTDYVPWTEYFESVEYVEITLVTVKKLKKDLDTIQLSPYNVSVH